MSTISLSSPGSVAARPRVAHATAPIRVLDLFAGAGGLSAGLAAADPRFRAVRAVEMDPAAAATYTINHGGNIEAGVVGGDLVFCGPIEDWLVQEQPPAVDVVVGGPPCQGFSTLGLQQADDVRNGLWKDYARIVAAAAPQYFVLENVPAFLRSPQWDLFGEATGPSGVLADYAFRAEVLNAADFGAAQARKRVVVIGHHRDVAAPGMPEPTHGLHVTLGALLRDEHRVRPAVVETALPDGAVEYAGATMPGAFRTQDLHVGRTYTEISRKRFRAIGAGENRFVLPDHLKAPCWRKHSTGSADVMGRLTWDKPSVTIRTEFFKPEKGRYLHPTEHRAITHLEAALIQGFPLDYGWVGSKTSIARQIGNAVPIPLGRAIGKLLVSALASES